MEFSELLNQIIERTGCTAKELSEISGISPASLSRYRSGERMPEYEQMQKLLQGLKCGNTCGALRTMLGTWGVLT